MKTYKNGCLKSSIMAWTLAQTALDCINICQKNIECMSVSFSSTAGTCVLHWSDSTDQEIIPSSQCGGFQKNIKEAQWTYYELLCNTSYCSTEIHVMLFLFEILFHYFLKGC